MFVLQRESERHTERNMCVRGVEVRKRAAKPDNQRSLDGAERPFAKRLIRFYRTLLQKINTFKKAKSFETKLYVSEST